MGAIVDPRMDGAMPAKNSIHSCPEGMSTYIIIFSIYYQMVLYELLYIITCSIQHYIVSYIYCIYCGRYIELKTVKKREELVQKKSIHSRPKGISTHIIYYNMYYMYYIVLCISYIYCIYYTRYVKLYIYIVQERREELVEFYKVDYNDHILYATSLVSVMHFPLSRVSSCANWGVAREQIIYICIHIDLYVFICIHMYLYVYLCVYIYVWLQKQIQV